MEPLSSNNKKDTFEPHRKCLSFFIEKTSIETFLKMSQRPQFIESNLMWTQCILECRSSAV